MVALCLVGVTGAEVLKEAGVNIAGKAGMAAVKKVPAEVLKAINAKVGFRLLTKFGEKGVINLAKIVPVAASAVGAGVNTTSMMGIAKYAKLNFPPVPEAPEAGR